MNLRLAFIPLLLLCGCAAAGRADDAAAAKAQMVGMSREDVLACMGIPKKKASEGTTEVWSYLSTNGHSDYDGTTVKPTGLSFTNGSHTRSFCTVNIVMKNAIVTVVRYNGPNSSSIFTTDDQCGFAVANCVGK